MRVKTNWVWATAALLAIIGAVTTFGWMTINTAEAKSGGWIAAVVLIGLGIVAGVSHFATASKEGHGLGWRFLMTGKGLATFVSAALAGLGAMSLLFPLLDPPSATQADVAEARDVITARMDQQFGAPQSTRGVLVGIAGAWGEGGCTFVYRFQIKDGAVLIDLAKKPVGMSAYSMAASIVPSSDDAVAHATIERSTEGDEPGDSVVFTYSNNGKERLIWLNRSQGNVGGLELDRCTLSD